MEIAFEFSTKSLQPTNAGATLGDPSKAFAVNERYKNAEVSRDTQSPNTDTGRSDHFKRLTCYIAEHSKLISLKNRGFSHQGSS